MIKEYDVIVIGGGPAGGQCARELSAKGYETLLVERYKSFEDNNFSSAGMTLAPLEEFNIPKSVIGSYWNDLVIQCSKDAYRWKGDQRKGVVLDFGRLRQFLADETTAKGGEVLMGHRYVKKTIVDDGIIAEFKNAESSEIIKLKAKLLVDGTGPLRKVMFDSKDDQPEMVYGSGIEYLIKVDQEAYDRYKDALIFFLGDKWALKGYSWIFPMENKILKVGSGKVHIQAKDEEKTTKTTKKLTEKIIKEYIKPKDYSLIDVHGGTLRYSPSIQDTFYKDKVFAVGDAVSTVNPLGGEGIRYAMQSASLAVTYIDEYLQKGTTNFGKYRKKWRRKHLLKWQISEVSSRRMYGKYTDEQIEKRIFYFHKSTNIDSLIDTLFNFRFNKLIWRIFQVYYLKFKDRWTNEKF
ncbi:MAG: NAD(P)/FAD-dependent oxidoreductase [Flavobacteriaceae bacterium]